MGELLDTSVKRGEAPAEATAEEQHIEIDALTAQQRVAHVLRLCGVEASSADLQTVIDKHAIPEDDELQYLGANVLGIIDDIAERGMPEADEIETLYDTGLILLRKAS